MKKTVFRFLSRVNRWVLPRYSQRDLSKLSRLDKALIAWRYWVTRNAL
jgi:hypothetical protein